MLLSFRRAILSSLFVVISALPLWAQLISGSGSITLAGPATREESAKAQEKALQKLKIELLHWLEEGAEISIDTSNPVQNLSFSMFLDSCRQAAKSETSFRGKALTLTYNLTADQVRGIITRYNTAVDSRAINAWNNLKEATGRNDLNAIYKEGVTALFFSMAHFGPPLATPDGGGRDLPYDARRIVQKFFDKMEVRSSAMILAGKTGLPIQEPPTLYLKMNDQPYPGITFSGRLQNGTILFNTVTDDSGSIVINQIKIPFVANGTLLEVIPNPAPVIGAPGFLHPAAFGIQLNNSQLQSFMFKIDRPVYTLDYNAASVSNIKLPADFADPAHVKKFLRDSCFLKEKTGSLPTDLDITIKAQVSSYTYDETEEIGVKVTAQIIVNGLLLQPPHSSENQFVFEKRYGRYLTVPYGLYFWEVNGKLRETIKATIAGL